VNYLAHLYLSGSNEGLLIGNFIADAVKGKAMNTYSDEVRRGIVLHRAIDQFTDDHPLHRASRTKLHHRYGHYSGVLVDIYYDHFLAKYWHDYSDTELLAYTKEVYAVMQKNKAVLPERITYMLQYMIPHNWLYNYANLEGVHKVFCGMAKRTKFESNMETGVEDLKEKYDEFKADFTDFFPQLKEFVKNKVPTI